MRVILNFYCQKMKSKRLSQKNQIDSAEEREEYHLTKRDIYRKRLKTQSSAILHAR